MSNYSSPLDVAVDKTGYIYVADIGNHRIQKLSSAGVYKTKWGGSGSTNEKFNTPSGVAVYANNFAYVADTNNNRIQKFSNTGSYQTIRGSSGTENSQFKTPARITVNSAGLAYIADTVNNRMTVWKKPVSSVSAESVEMEENLTPNGSVVRSFHAPEVSRQVAAVPVVEMPVMRNHGSIDPAVVSEMKNSLVNNRVVRGH